MAPAFPENTAAPLTRATVHQVLTNPKFIGAHITINEKKYEFQRAASISAGCSHISA
jgi:hypothetical protein